MSRQWKIIIAVALVAGVGLAALYFPRLSSRVLHIGRNQPSDDQARREVVAPPPSTATDVTTPATIYWASADDLTRLAPAEVRLALSAGQTDRARQVIDALIAGAPSPAQRTLPDDTTLLGFYLLQDGEAVADFSDNLARETPSGILSEQLAVDSITRTLEANVTSIQKLKILIHGQEAETLAGHVDLTGFFTLLPTATSAPGADGTSTGETKASAFSAH
jgi:spore germination protein GerM